VVRVLVVGPPRSGTTWIGQALGRASDTCYVHEPDGDHDAFALKVKRGGPRHVELKPGDDAPGYEQLWSAAFVGGQRRRSIRARLAEHWFDASTISERARARRGEQTPLRLRAALTLAQPLEARPGARHVVVKSVHACLAVDWLADRFQPTVIVVERNPLNVLASWDESRHGVDPFEYSLLREVGRRRWRVELPDVDAAQIVRQAAFLGVLRGALTESTSGRATWLRAGHDELLQDPLGQLADLSRQAGLEFSAAAATYVQESNRHGEGYSTQRLAAELPQKWRRLSDEQVTGALETLQRFPSHLGLVQAAEKGIS
jgi:sulfotransferase family protein